jgi:hypothetical protein
MNKGQQYEQYDSNIVNTLELVKDPVVLNHQNINVNIINQNDPSKGSNANQNEISPNNLPNQQQAENQLNNEEVRQINLSTLDESIGETFVILF